MSLGCSPCGAFVRRRGVQARFAEDRPADGADHVSLAGLALYTAAQGRSPGGLLRLPAPRIQDLADFENWRIAQIGTSDGAACAAAWPERQTSSPFRKVANVAWGFSSGDLNVDRRLGFAECMQRAGDLSAAIEVLTDALELAPDRPAGWFRLAEWLERAGQSDRAITAWDRARGCDPTDRLGAGPKRDLARATPLTETLPAGFVETLFDQYADTFDESLVDRLGYRAPGLLRAALAGQRFERAMDLGCGTGLAGEAFRPVCAWLEGCDLSAGMLAQAEAKGVYDHLFKADLAALKITSERFDLILAADVFVYIGALERIIAWCAGSLRPGGVLAFTVEAGEAPLALRESRRFAHSHAYLTELMASAGFCEASLTRVPLRRDRGVEIEGFVVVARLLTVHDRQGDGEDAVPA